MAVAPSVAGPASTGRGAAYLDALRAALPGLRLLTDPAETEAYRWDETEYMSPGLPLGVAFPESTADVATIVRLAGEHRTAIVPRGAGTGLSGGAIAVEGALTLVMTRMNRVLEIDTANQLAVVQPGIINADLGRAVAEHGLFYPPDPASFETCSIGGNLAENSGRPALREVRRHARLRDGTRGRSCRRLRHPHRRPDGQGRDGLRPDAAVRRLGGDARRHHGGDPAAAPRPAAEAHHAGVLRHRPRLPARRSRA